VVGADQVSVRRRLSRHDLLRQPLEQLASILGGPSVEAEREFVKVIIAVGRTGGPLMRSQQQWLRERRHAVNAREQLAG
jgi:hypothetical protein